MKLLDKFRVGFWQMLLFIIIFFAMVIIVGVTAVAGFSVYLKRRTKSLQSNDQKQFDEPPKYHSLFEPDDEERRMLEREAQMKVEAERLKAERESLFEKREAVREFEKIWRAEPNKQNTVELLRRAAMSESAEIFSQTAENVLQMGLYEQAGNLTANDLADLLDSHLRILPQQERLSGAIFWIKREIERLRGKSEASK